MGFSNLLLMPPIGPDLAGLCLATSHAHQSEADTMVVRHAAGEVEVRLGFQD